MEDFASISTMHIELGSLTGRDAVLIIQTVMFGTPHFIVGS